MISHIHIKSAFDSYLESLNVSKKYRPSAMFNVKLVKTFIQKIEKEYGIVITINKNFEFYVVDFKDEESAIMFKLQYG